MANTSPVTKTAAAAQKTPYGYKALVKKTHANGTVTTHIPVKHNFPTAAAAVAYATKYLAANA